MLPPGWNDCSLFWAHPAHCSYLWSRGWDKPQELHRGRRCPWFPKPCSTPQRQAYVPSLLPFEQELWKGAEPHLSLWQYRENFLKEDKLGVTWCLGKMLVAPETFGKLAPHNVSHLGFSPGTWRQPPGRWSVRQSYSSLLYTSPRMLSRFCFLILTLRFFLLLPFQDHCVTLNNWGLHRVHLCFSSTWHGLWHTAAVIVGSLC